MHRLRLTHYAGKSDVDERREKKLFEQLQRLNVASQVQVEVEVDCSARHLSSLCLKMGEFEMN